MGTYKRTSKKTGASSREYYTRKLDGKPVVSNSHRSGNVTTNRRELANGGTRTTTTINHGDGWVTRRTESKSPKRSRRNAYKNKKSTAAEIQGAFAAAILAAILMAVMLVVGLAF